MDPTTSRGFSRPTTTPTPDELFDVWLPQLSGGELKVLLYIVRRTLGFKKDADTISLSQICDGITTKDGRVLDQGTGLSRNTAIQAIKGLTEKGLVRVERGQDERGIHETNTYRLRFRGDDDDQVDEGDPPPGQGSAKSEPGVVQKSHYGSAKNEPGVVQKSNPQQTDQQQTEPPLPPPAPAVSVSGGTSSAGGGDISLASDPLSPEGKDPVPDEQEEACQLLVEFGVWEKPARQLVTSLALTPELVRRACAALEAESAQGKSINNLSAILCHRLLQGWVPPEAELPPEEDITGLEYIEARSSSIEVGVSTAIDMIRKVLLDDYRVSYEQHELEQAMRRGWLVIDGKKHPLNGLASERLDPIARSIEAQARTLWNVGTLNAMVLAGGGALALKPWLASRLPQATYAPDAAMANAAGFLRYGLRQWAQAVW